MKPSILQTLRRTPSPASHGGRPKETPPPSKHHPKIVPKCLSTDFSTVPEEISTESLDLVESSPEASSTVEDPPEVRSFLFEDFTPADLSALRTQKPPTSPPFLPTLPKAEEHGSQGSVEIAVKKAAEGEGEGEGEEEKVEEVVERLREALLEVRKSRDVSGGSKRLLGALVEVAIGDAGGDPRAENGRRDSAFWAKVRIGIVCFMILLVALMNLLAVSAVLNGGGGRDLFGLPPPT